MNKGIKLTYIAITMNLIIAGLIIIRMFGRFSDLTDLISEWTLNLGIGILALYISGIYVGNKIEYLIDHKKWNSFLVGMVGLIIILLIGIFFGSTVGFLQEGIENINRENGLENALIDYYIKPLFWIILFGIIPTIIVGGIMGYGIRKNVLQQWL
jgi:hypothetical protein